MDLKVEELTIEYSSAGYVLRPIDHLDLTAAGGSLVLLLGPSGCGKTSLLSCLGGILTPKSGSISFGDVEVTKLSGAALTEYRRTMVGFVFQAFNLVASMTATENVMVPLCNNGMHMSEARERARTLLESVGLADRAVRRPSDLSGGQQQRVAIARALALDPPLILADEPTAHLDYVQVEGVIKLLRELASGDRLVVIATHDNRLLPIADRVVELVPEFGDTSREPERIKLAAGEVLFQQGSWGDLIYVVDEGEIEIVEELADGGMKVRNVLGAGGYFGEVGPIFGLPRSATARARTDTLVLGYTTRDFRDRVGPLPDLVAANPEVVEAASFANEDSAGSPAELSRPN